MALPKFIYIYEEKENDGSTFYCATTDSSALFEGVIGVYDLREVPVLPGYAMLQS